MLVGGVSLCLWILITAPSTTFEPQRAKDESSSSSLRPPPCWASCDGAGEGDGIHDPEKVKN